MLPTVDDTAVGTTKENYAVMPSIHKVIEYSGLNYYQALDLPCDVFQLMLKSAIVEKLNETEEGQQYLEKCERLNTTEPDLASLHKKYRSK